VRGGSQALDCIRFLEGKMALERSRMRIRISVPIVATDANETMLRCLEDLGVKLVEVKAAGGATAAAAKLTFESAILPALYRPISDAMQAHGSAMLQVLDAVVTEQMDTSLERLQISAAADPSIPAATAMNCVPARDSYHVDSSSGAVTIPRSQATKVLPSRNSTAKKCRACGGAFADTKLYRAHFKSEWHRYNQKSKLRSLPVLDEAQFNALSREDVLKMFNAE